MENVRELESLGTALGLEEQCRSYSPPARRIAYESDPDAARQLCDTGNYELFTPHSAMHTAFRRNRAWEDYSHLVVKNQRRQTAVLFLHERMAAGGKPRLVCIELGWVGFYLSKSTLLYVTTVELNSYLQDVKQYHLTDWEEEEEPIQTFLHRFGARVYEGLADDRDLSHFSIEMESDSKIFVVDGWLLPNGHIKLAMRDGDPKGVTAH
jgi:hypothetical protein